MLYTSHNENMTLDILHVYTVLSTHSRLAAIQTVQLYSSTAVQLYSCTAVQLYCCTAALLYSCTTVEDTALQYVVGCGAVIMWPGI